MENNSNTESVEHDSNRENQPKRVRQDNNLNGSRCDSPDVSPKTSERGSSRRVSMASSDMLFKSRTPSVTSSNCTNCAKARSSQDTAKNSGSGAFDIVPCCTAVDPPAPLPSMPPWVTEDVPSYVIVPASAVCRRPVAVKSVAVGQEDVIEPETLAQGQLQSRPAKLKCISFPCPQTFFIPILTNPFFIVAIAL